MSKPLKNFGRVLTPIKFSSAERKIFIVFVYYLASGAMQLTTFSVANKYVAHDVELITNYFNCQRSGYNSTCSLDTTQSHPVLLLLALIFLLLFPAINLVFTANLKDLRMFCKVCTAGVKTFLPNKQPKHFSHQKTVQKLAT